MESHLLQMRGLKPASLCRHDRLRQVASFTDAWIETWVAWQIISGKKSHLLQMRDWNHSSKARLNVSLMSHPLRGQLL